MSKVVRTVGPALLLAVLCLAVPAKTQPTESWIDLGRAVATELSGRQLAKVEARFDGTMAAALPASRLEAIWDGLLAQVGAFRAIAGARVEEVQGYHVVFVTCQFEKATLDAKLVFDAQRRLAGLFFVPSQPKVEWTPPEYAKTGSFRERALVVGSDPWQLPGMLTLPEGPGPFPAVVLVHGSGPQDGDETLGPNKPFKDLAWGLASRGVAVLRYTKRTAEHGAKLRLDAGTFTVEEETVADARAALALAAQQPEIDRGRVFLLGHSLGGMLAPRIAKGAPVAGIILMAANARPLQTLVVEQVRYITSLDPAGAAAGAAAVHDAEEAAREIESPTLQPATPVKLLGTTIPGSYFLDLRGYDPVRAAAALPVPILVLQGERDYQVTRADFDAWKAALAEGPRATFHLYPGLYHLFLPSSTPGNGLGSPADYEKPGHVAAAVVDDIASWIAGLRPAPP
jgi:hypothetical protein